MQTFVTSAIRFQSPYGDFGTLTEIKDRYALAVSYVFQSPYGDFGTLTPTKCILTA